MDSTRKTVIVVGEMDNVSAVERRLAEKGYALKRMRDVDEAFRFLTSGKADSPGSLYVIGSDVSEVHGKELARWIDEEGGGPYVLVRRSDNERSSISAYAYIEPSQSVDQVVSLFQRFLEKNSD